MRKQAVRTTCPEILLVLAYEKAVGRQRPKGVFFFLLSSTPFRCGVKEQDVNE